MPLKVSGKGPVKLRPDRAFRQKNEAVLVAWHLGEIPDKKPGRFIERVARIKREIERTPLSLKAIAKALEEKSELVEKVNEALRIRPRARGRVSPSFWRQKFLRKALRLAPFTTEKEMSTRRGRNINITAQLKSKWKFWPVEARRFLSHLGYYQIFKAAYLLQNTQLPLSKICRIAALDPSWASVQRHKRKIEKITEFVSSLPAYRHFARQVEKKQKMGYSPEEAIYGVEAERYWRDKKIFGQLLKKTRNREIKMVIPSEKKRTLARLETLARRTGQNVPSQIRKQLGS